MDIIIDIEGDFEKVANNYGSNGYQIFLSRKPLNKLSKLCNRKSILNQLSKLKIDNYLNIESKKIYSTVRYFKDSYFTDSFYRKNESLEMDDYNLNISISKLVSLLGSFSVAKQIHLFRIKHVKIKQEEYFFHNPYGFSEMIFEDNLRIPRYRRVGDKEELLKIRITKQAFCLTSVRTSICDNKHKYLVDSLLTNFSSQSISKKGLKEYLEEFLKERVVAPYQRKRKLEKLKELFKDI